MSYARWGVNGSDVYVIEDALNGGFSCIGCILIGVKELMLGNEQGEGSYTCETRGEMLAHLMHHRMFGNKVPDEAINRLREEIYKEEANG